MENKKAISKEGAYLISIIALIILSLFAVSISAQTSGNSYFTITIDDTDLHQVVLIEGKMTPMKICNLQGTAQKITFETIATKFPFDMQIWEIKNNSYIVNDYNQSCLSFTEANLSINQNCTTIISGSHTEYRLENIPFTKTTLAPSKQKHNETQQNPNTCKDFYYRLRVPKNTRGEYNITIWDDNNNSYVLDPWWNGSWTYKKQINFTGSDNQINGSTMLTISPITNMASDGSDLRFLNSSEDGELTYWVRSTNATAFVVFVKIPNNSTIYMYYNSTGAVTTSNKASIVEVANQGFAYTGGSSGIAINTTYGTQINTRFKIMLLEANRTDLATSISSRVFINNTNLTDYLLDEQMINYTTDSAYHSYILNASTNYKLVYTSTNQTFARRYVNLPVYPIVFKNFDYTTGVNAGTGGRNTDPDMYQYRGITTTVYNEYSSVISGEISNAVADPIYLNVTLSTPSNNSNFIYRTLNFSALFDVFSYNMTNATLNILNSTSVLAVTSMNSVTGNRTNSTNFTNIAMPYDDDFRWNVYLCALNNSGSNICNYSISNRTFRVDIPPVIASVSIADNTDFGKPISEPYLPLSIAFNITERFPSNTMVNISNATHTILFNASIALDSSVSFNLTSYSGYNINITTNDSQNSIITKVIPISMSIAGGGSGSGGATFDASILGLNTTEIGDRIRTISNQSTLTFIGVALLILLGIGAITSRRK